MESKLLWNNKYIDVVKIDNGWYALDGWNGEKFTDCWETDENTIAINDGAVYEATPTYSHEWEIIDYEIRRVR